MNKINSYPPFDNLLQILKNCPKSALLYCQLWELKDSNNEVHVDKLKVQDVFCISHTLFKNTCLPIAKDGLISFKKTKLKYVVEFI